MCVVFANSEDVIMGGTYLVAGSVSYRRSIKAMETGMHDVQRLNNTLFLLFYGFFFYPISSTKMKDKQKIK